MTLNPPRAAKRKHCCMEYLRYNWIKYDSFKPLQFLQWLSMTLEGIDATLLGPEKTPRTVRRPTHVLSSPGAPRTPTNAAGGWRRGMRGCLLRFALLEAGISVLLSFHRDVILSVFFEVAECRGGK